MEMSLQEAMQLWRSHANERARYGVHLPDAVGYATDSIKFDYGLAMDALPQLTTAPNSAIPVMLTTFIDPNVIEIVFAPMMATEIFGEQKKGDWLMETAMFPIVEATGEVSSYGDFSQDGRAGLNTN